METIAKPTVQRLRVAKHSNDYSQLPIVALLQLFARSDAPAVLAWCRIKATLKRRGAAGARPFIEMQLRSLSL